VTIGLAAVITGITIASRQYLNFLTEKKGRQEDQKVSAPKFYQKAQSFLNRKELDNAWREINTALIFQPDFPDALMLKTQILLSRKQFSKSAEVLDQYLELSPGDLLAKNMRAACHDLHKNPGNEKSREVLFKALEKIRALIPLEILSVERERLLSLYRSKLAKHFLMNDFDLVSGGKLRVRSLMPRVKGEFSGLEGIPINILGLRHQTIRNLAVLRGMPLESLNLSQSKVADLGPLKGMALEELNLAKTSVTDLSPLEGMPLRSLDISFTKIKDLSILETLPLLILNAAELQTPSLDPIGNISTLINLSLNNANIKRLDFLKNLHLKKIQLRAKSVVDFTPLAGMPLESLELSHMSHVDFGQIKGRSLKTLKLTYMKNLDLRPLKNSPLIELRLARVENTDFAPIAEIKTLQRVWLGKQSLDSLKLLVGLPLKFLNIEQINREDLDLKFLLEIPTLETLYANPSNLTGLRILKNHKNLKFIKVKSVPLPVNEFWKKYGKD